MAFQGSLKELPLPDIIQLVSVSGKTGVFNLKNGNDAGVIYLRDGHIVHAEAGELEGEEAVYELAIWPQGDFVFTPGREAPSATIQKSNTNLLMEAARRIDEWQVLSKRIPSTRLVPVFTQQSAKTSVSFAPQEWAVVCKVDERRSIEEIALSLGNSPFDTCKILYGLITSGLVELKDDLGQMVGARLRTLPATDLQQLAEAIHRQAKQLLGTHPRAADLDSAYRLARAGVESGRGGEAVLDLIRAMEKLVSSTLGAEQGKTLLGRIRRLTGA